MRLHSKYVFTSFLIGSVAWFLGWLGLVGRRLPLRLSNLEVIHTIQDINTR